MLYDRLRQALHYAGVSQAELARACKVKPSSVHGWLSGKTAYMRCDCLVTASKLLGISAQWLATGDGSMLQSGAHDYRRNNIDDRLHDISDHKHILRDFVNKKSPKDIKNIKIITAHGDGLAPKIKHGDILFVDCSLKEFREKGIYVLNINGFIHVATAKKNGEAVAWDVYDSNFYTENGVAVDDASTIIVLGLVIYSLQGKTLINI